ncbi:MAG: hypothetical protein IJB89_03570 [Akkermansia sp.]|nr:hypothetical protein [Akkermansia sp.]
MRLTVMWKLTHTAHVRDATVQVPTTQDTACEPHAPVAEEAGEPRRLNLYIQGIVSLFVANAAVAETIDDKKHNETPQSA